MSERQHAYLSASSAHRWLICPPIVQFESEIPERSSPYAEEGTEAHTLAELKLRDFLGENVKKELEAFRVVASYHDGEMEEATDLYRDLVIERYNSYDSPQIELEVRVDFSKWVPDGFGTSDVVILGDNVIEIIDLKYGKGVQVEAYQNPQLMLYALGAYAGYDLVYDFEFVRMTVVQPRLDHIETFEIHVDELIYWANNYVAPRAEMAFEGRGEWNITEDVMKFSPVRAQLRPRAEKNFELIDKYIEEDTALLEDEEIAEILSQASEIKKWIEHVEGYALGKALSGEEIPGFKLVEGRSNRKITDEADLAVRLIMEGYESDDIYKPVQLQTLTALEKLVGKKRFSEIAVGLIDKPAGKPTLVPNSDKRPALNSAESALKDFENIN